MRGVTGWRSGSEVLRSWWLELLLLDGRRLRGAAVRKIIVCCCHVCVDWLARVQCCCCSQTMPRRLSVGVVRRKRRGWRTVESGGEEGIRSALREVCGCVQVRRRNLQYKRRVHQAPRAAARLLGIDIAGLPAAHVVRQQRRIKPSMWRPVWVGVCHAEW